MLWLDAHADYNTPETTPSGNLHGMALAFLAGEPSARGRSSASGRSIRCRAATSTSSAPARSIPASGRGWSPTGIDCVDMRPIDERGVSALLAERIARLAGGAACICM